MALRPRLLSGALTALLACGSPAGTVEMRWTGGDTGSAELAASATRCGGGPVELLAASGDTGLAIAFYGSDPLGAGAYPVSQRAAGSPPPAASFGVRWLDSTAVSGYRGRSGTVTLSAAGTELAGRFAVEAQRTPDGREVSVSGAFRGIPVEACRENRTMPGD